MPVPISIGHAQPSATTDSCPAPTAPPTRKPWAWLQTPPSQHGATPVQGQPVSFDALQPERTTRWEIRNRVTISPNALDLEDLIP
ncbi:hypothetical protein ACFY5F_50480 [Streptomyces sp. NPDC013161]|uniref:hypothetical protein n=1 Tax=Streptomyces sp. NPDC013161 TaxID=3364862 RepID=UPI0036AD1A77